MSDDYRLIAARRLVWKEELWREPALVALAISGLRTILMDESESDEARTEGRYLIKKLLSASKQPPL
jgi:hypothetical protein